MSESYRSPPLNCAIIVHRIVQAGLFLTLTWKWSYFVGASRVYGSIILDDPFFPELMRAAWSVRLAFVAAVTACTLSLVTASRRVQIVCGWTSLLTATFLCLHQASYNDMTFVTAWWTSLWVVWYLHRLDKEEPAVLLSRAAFLSRIIISVILLGGGLGKWTAEYWSGEVLFDIYFLDRDYWVFNILRTSFDPEGLREIAKWYSRLVIATETISGAFLWLLPSKWAAIFAMVILLSIAMLSNFYLFSVLSCLICLASVGLFDDPIAGDADDSSPVAAADGTP